MNFLRTAHASLAEVGYCVHVAHRLAYISDELAADLEREVKQVGAPLAGLIRSVQMKRTMFAGATVVVLVILVARLA